ncbi:uncharacterized protein LOC143465483 [Clavelina lepadiformis]|uniref:Uncharacterized protein n=1 Tax=Clavelina lepadiformis TaxID=159417 RepID=A0ABP0EWP5_CLALP
MANLLHLAINILWIGLVFSQSGEDFLTNRTDDVIFDEEDEVFVEPEPPTGSGSEEVDYTYIDRDYNEYHTRVSDVPLLNPPCLLPSQKIIPSNSLHQRQRLMNDRLPLHSSDLLSNETYQAGLLAVSKFMSVHSNSTLLMTELLGGCKQHISGKLLYLMFNAREEVQCSNCTRNQVFDRECRARIYLPDFAPWRPFFVECMDPLYYALPWRKLSV